MGEQSPPDPARAGADDSSSARGGTTGIRARSSAGANDARAAALEILTQVFGEPRSRHRGQGSGGGRSLGSTLEPGVGNLHDSRERAFARELCYGVLRWLPRLAAVLEQLLRRPLRERDVAVRVLLLMGLYQLLFLRVPAHAAVAATVRVARGLPQPWASGLVNAVLRTFQRERQRILAHIERDPAAVWAHPAWLIDEVRVAWPEDWRRVLAANNDHPPMTLRVNARRGTRRDYLQTLAGRGLTAYPAAYTDQGVTLAQPIEVERLPGFTEGLVSVQDGAAQLAAGLLGLQPGQRVLDACAAPGGKTAHLLEREPGLARLVAIDRDPARIPLLEDNLRRLGLVADVVCADATEPARWWDGVPFDRILLDAPCSATGVIRRHPDIKLHRRPADIAAVGAVQARLLDSLWPLLAPHGMLLYATCSILPQENRAQIEGFLARHADAHAPPTEVGWGRPGPPGRQILAGEDGMDGFYYAVLAKR